MDSVRLGLIKSIIESYNLNQRKYHALVTSENAVEIKESKAKGYQRIIHIYELIFDEKWGFMKSIFGTDPVCYWDISKDCEGCYYSSECLYPLTPKWRFHVSKIGLSEDKIGYIISNIGY